MTKIVAFINQKGGTGKNTSAVNIGAGLAAGQAMPARERGSGAESGA